MTKIHPVIRILCLLIVSFFVVSAKPLFLLVTLPMLLLGFSMGATGQLARCVRILVRLKWLFFSILFIYVVLTPGHDIFPINFFNRYPLGALLNSILTGYVSVEGIYLGMMRVSSLMILILTVNLFIQPEQHSELSYAIVWLLSPLKYLSCPVDRLAVRVSLTFRYLDEFQQLLALHRNPKKNNSDQILTITEKNSMSLLGALKCQKQKFHYAVNQAINKSVELVETVLSSVTAATVEPINKSLVATPKITQWLLPISLLVIYSSLASHSIV